MTCISISLGGTKWSSGFKIVSNITSLASCVETEVVSFSFFSSGLAVDIFHILSAEGLTLFAVESLGSNFDELLNPFSGFSCSLLVTLGMGYSEHSVVVIIDIKLHWVLVISEKSIMSICEISEGTSLFKTKTKSEKGFETKK